MVDLKFIVEHPKFLKKVVEKCREKKFVSSRKNRGSYFALDFRIIKNKGEKKDFEI